MNTMRTTAIVAAVIAASTTAVLFHYRSTAHPLMASVLTRMRLEASTADNVARYGMQAPPPDAGDDLKGAFDQFGQYAGADWPGKIHSLADLQQQAAADQSLTPVDVSDFDKYGGWLKGPSLNSTGYFRTERVNGRWWLVTPDGHVFLSIGIDGVTPDDETFTEGRAQMFSWLPAAGDPLSKHAGTAHGFKSKSGSSTDGATFNFYTANLERKYGDGYLDRWRSTAIVRLKAWGFNTLGGWSDGPLTERGLPYIVNITTTGPYHHVSSGSDLWGKLPDPFDPAFEAAVVKHAGAIAKHNDDDPYFIGFCVDNELSWASKDVPYGIVDGALNEDAAQSPAKQELLQELQTRYATVDRFNAVWGTSFTTWTDLDAPFHVPSTPSSQVQRDESDFLLAFARRYFSTVHSVLRQLDPNHLYLGCRFAHNRFTPEVLKAAAENCDVLSFNIYGKTISDWPLAEIDSLGKPCLVTEFHFAATDHGEFSGGMYKAADQAERGALYAGYVDSVADDPNFVGWHWYQYVDQPPSGTTWNGENANTGFVDIADTPYTELVQSATAANLEAYPRHMKAQ